MPTNRGGVLDAEGLGEDKCSRMCFIAGIAASPIPFLWTVEHARRRDVVASE